MKNRYRAEAALRCGLVDADRRVPFYEPGCEELLEEGQTSLLLATS